MRRLLLQILAAVSWVAVIVGTFTGFDDDLEHFSSLDFRMWLAALFAALVLSLAVLLDQAERVYTALATAVVSRPLYRGDTGPQVPVIRQQQPAADGTLSVPGRRRGLHATRGSAEFSGPWAGRGL